MTLRIVCSCWLITAAATWCSLLLTSNYLLSLQSFRDELLTTLNPIPHRLRSPPASFRREEIPQIQILAPPPASASQAQESSIRSTNPAPNCTGRYVYMYDLPPKFNQKLLEQCSSLSIWTNMCPHISNAGLGKPIRFRNFTSGWYATNQFTAELIFHESMKRYECLTRNPASATAFYVPFYGGFEMSRLVDHPNSSLRDELGLELGQWLESRPEWKQQQKYYNHQLRNHFMVLGRITWDFMREDNRNRGWGNNLLAQPFTKKMMILLVEAHPWHQNEFGIPYPTYFHPSSALELETWKQQLTMIRRSQHTKRISFVGGAKVGNPLRNEVMSRCRSSAHCTMLDCSLGTSAACHDPEEVMSLLLESTFCLQPRGDSFTRRSVFDSLIAACIPVVFSEHSMFSQYRWNVRAEECSVLIPEEEVLRDSRVIEERLFGIPEEDVERMQERLIEMLPLVSYGDPRISQGVLGFNDAFRGALEGITGRVRSDQESLASAAGSSRKLRRKKRNKKLEKKQTLTVK